MSSAARYGLVFAAMAGVVALRVVAVLRAPFNWDEWALFDGLARSLEEGVLRSGGRPGLTQILLLPLVEGCRDEVAVARTARALWLGVTFAYLGGLFALLHEAFRERRERVHDACLGVALLGALPVFLEWSVQVRTDQLALVGAVWGGFVLLRSEAKPGLALLAGLLFGMGWLSSQKLAYAGALVGLLAAGRLHWTRSFTMPREAWRFVLLVAGFGTVLLCFRSVLMVWFTLPETHAAREVLGGAQLATAQQRTFPFYRNTIGYSQYEALLPTLVPHVLLLLGLAAVSFQALRRGAPDRRADAVWAVLALGLAVGLFHAAAFSYFWMTLGLFPAIACAIAVGPLRDWLRAKRPEWVRPAAVILWTAIAIPATLTSIDLLRDRQAVQRESLAFVHRNFSEQHTGFHPEGALFCDAPQGLGIWFSQRLHRVFEGPARDAHAERVEHYFRTTPVHYVLESFRLNQFPLELRRFFAEHYQPYRDAVFVAGARLEGDQRQRFELLVEGPYRWIPFGEAGSAKVDDTHLSPGEVVVLAAGPHAGRVPDGGSGMLVLSLQDPPGPAPLAFYEPF